MAIRGPAHLNADGDDLRRRRRRVESVRDVERLTEAVVEIDLGLQPGEVQLLIGEDAFDQDPGGGVMRPGGGLRRSIEVGRSPSLASHVVVEHLANRRPDVWLGHGELWDATEVDEAVQQGRDGHGSSAIRAAIGVAKPLSPHD
jgi:hypothetical protein